MAFKTSQFLFVIGIIFNRAQKFFSPTPSGMARTLFLIGLRDVVFGDSLASASLSDINIFMSLPCPSPT